MVYALAFYDLLKAGLEKWRREVVVDNEKNGMRWAVWLGIRACDPMCEYIRPTQA